MVASAERDKPPQRGVELVQGHVAREVQHILELCRPLVSLSPGAESLGDAPDQNCWGFSMMYTMPLTSIVALLDNEEQECRSDVVVGGKDEMSG